jgi:hypothetical protein
VPCFRPPEEDIFLHYRCKSPNFFPLVEKLSGGEIFPHKRLQNRDSCAKNLHGFLLDNAQFGKVEHDLLFSVVLESNRCDRAMSRSFDADDFTKAKLLMLYFLSGL